VRTRHETDSHVLLLSQYVDFNVGDVVLCVWQHNVTLMMICHGHGTVFVLVSLQHLHCRCSKDNWKLSCLIS